MSQEGVPHGIKQVGRRNDSGKPPAPNLDPPNLPCSTKSSSPLPPYFSPSRPRQRGSPDSQLPQKCFIQASVSTSPSTRYRGLSTSTSITLFSALPFSLSRTRVWERYWGKDMTLSLMAIPSRVLAPLTCCCKSLKIFRRHLVKRPSIS